MAQNILSFLKANCTREGHTYWLFRPKGKDIVKLYDLTTLTSTDDSAKVIKWAEKWVEFINPYRVNKRRTHLLKMLLFYFTGNVCNYLDFECVLFLRVSQRMLQYSPHTGKDLATIKLLLENCIKLLHNDTSSQVHTTMIVIITIISYRLLCHHFTYWLILF